MIWLKKIPIFNCILILTFTFLVDVTSADVSSSNINDSLIASENFCQDSSDFQCAKSIYVKAYLNGMSKDSLCFFISGLYLKRGIFDTALVYNFACTSSIALFQQEILRQRTAILSGLGFSDTLKRTSSLQNPPIQAKKVKDTLVTFGVSTYFSFSDYKTEKTPMLDKDTIFKFSLPSFGLEAYFTKRGRNECAGFIPLYKTYVGGSIPVKINKDNTLSSKDAFLLSELRMENWRILSLSNAVSISFDDRQKVNFSESFSIEKPFKYNKGSYLSQISGRLEWSNDFALTEATTDLSLSYNKLFKNRLKQFFSFSFSYNWMYSNNSMKYKKGYTDSLKALTGDDPDNFVYRYYFDSLCTVRADPNRVSMYWDSDALPTGYWFYMKEKTANLVTSIGGSLKVKKKWQINSSIMLRGKFFVEKVSWYTTDSPLFFNQMQNGEFMLLLYDKQKDKLYFQSAPYSRTCNSGDTVPVSYHQTRRIDGTALIQMSIQYNMPKIGIFSFSSWISKNESTLKHYKFPIPQLNNAWGIYTEWRSDLWKPTWKK